MLTGILLANGTLNASILNSLYNENLVKEGKCCPTPTLGKDGGGQNHDKQVEIVTTVHPCSSLVSSGDRFTTALAKVDMLPCNLEGLAKT